MRLQVTPKTDQVNIVKVKDFQNAKRAADTIKEQNNLRIDATILSDVIIYMVQGFSNTAVIKKIKRIHNRRLSLKSVKKYRELYKDRINSRIKDFENDAIHAGIARREVRLSKLNDILEQIETQVIDPQSGKVNSSVVREIRQLISTAHNISAGVQSEKGDAAFNDMTNEELEKFIDNFVTKRDKNNESRNESKGNSGTAKTDEGRTIAVSKAAIT